MALRLSSIKIDTKREQDGDWIEIPEWPGVAFLMRGFQYGPFKAARDAAYKDLAKTTGSDAISDDDVFDLNGQLLAEHLLLGWRGLADDEDKPIAYDRQVARDLLTDRAWRIFQTKVMWAAAQLEVVDAKFIKDIEKN